MENAHPENLAVQRQLRNEVDADMAVMDSLFAYLVAAGFIRKELEKSAARRAAYVITEDGAQAYERMMEDSPDIGFH